MDSDLKPDGTNPTQPNEFYQVTQTEKHNPGQIDELCCFYCVEHGERYLQEVD